MIWGCLNVTNRRRGVGARCREGKITTDRGTQRALLPTPLFNLERDGSGGWIRQRGSYQSGQETRCACQPSESATCRARATTRPVPSSSSPGAAARPTWPAREGTTTAAVDGWMCHRCELALRVVHTSEFMTCDPDRDAIGATRCSPSKLGHGPCLLSSVAAVRVA